MLSEEAKRQIGQHFVFGFHGYEPGEDIVKLIRDYHVGSIIIFKRNIKDIPQLHKLIQSLQQIAKDSGHSQPLLIGIDQENGLVSAFSSTSTVDAGTQFPGAMALGRTGDPGLAEEVSNASGREMRLAGINWVYSPVADVNSDPRNPVIGVRSFGEDPQVVASFVCAVSRGLARAGLAACAKHFPGHGDTHVDSHLALPVITKDLRALEQTELVPFRALVNTAPAADSIMTAHVALPPLAADLGTDADPHTPASLAHGATTALLRNALGFRGVVVTDCLEMDAVAAGTGCGPGARAALLAGADVVMVCHRVDRQLAALDAAYAAVESGALGLGALSESGARVRALKDRVAGRWEHVLGTPLDTAALLKLKHENARLSRRAYARTTQWLTAPPARPAISPHADVLVLTPQPEAMSVAVDGPEEVLRAPDGSARNAAGPSFTAFASAVGRRAPFSSHLVYARADAHGHGDGLPARLAKSVLSAHTVVFATRNARQAAGAWQTEVLKRVVRVARAAGVVGEEGSAEVGVIVVASCAPYDLQLLEAETATKHLPCLCTFEHTKPALEEAAAKLYGETLAESLK